MTNDWLLSIHFSMPSDWNDSFSFFDLKERFNYLDNASKSYFNRVVSGKNFLHTSHKYCRIIIDHKIRQDCDEWNDWTVGMTPTVAYCWMRIIDLLRLLLLQQLNDYLLSLYYMKVISSKHTHWISISEVLGGDETTVDQLFSNLSNVGSRASAFTSYASFERRDETSDSNRTWQKARWWRSS